MAINNDLLTILSEKGLNIYSEKKGILKGLKTLDLGINHLGYSYILKILSSEHALEKTIDIVMYLKDIGELAPDLLLKVNDLNAVNYKLAFFIQDGNLCSRSYYSNNDIKAILEHIDFHIFTSLKTLPDLLD